MAQEKLPIPNGDKLFVRVHETMLNKRNELHAGVFRQQGSDGLSCDWSALCTPEETRQRAHEPERNGVLSLVAGEVRSVAGLEVEHDPKPATEGTEANPAHSLITGIEVPYGALTAKARKTMVRVKLLRLCDVEIPPPGLAA